MSKVYQYALKPVKFDLLKEQLQAAIAANLVSLTVSDQIIVEVVDADTNEAAVAAAVAAHDASVVTVDDKIFAAAGVSRNQVINYLCRQMISASPNTATIKATIEPYFTGNTELTNALNNAAAMFGYSLATDVGYVRSALMALLVVLLN